MLFEVGSKVSYKDFWKANNEEYLRQTFTNLDILLSKGDTF